MREKLTPTLSEVQAATAHLREFKEKPTAPAPIMPEMRIEPAKFVPQEGALVLSPEEIEEAAKRLREERESRVGALARKGAAFVRRMRGGGSRKIPRVKRVSRGTEKKSG
jgi:hypothetical protein